MTSDLSVPRDDAQADAATGVWSRMDLYLERAGEWLNPILVKESRQALKSKQFTITFALLLLCGWGWSFLGTMVGGRAVEIVYGYYWVLAIPLLVIVPFSAYRSLAAEREDGTYELLSITGLNSRQIVTGKLGSAILQMLVYYSALSPCIAFTYLLRGVSILSVLLILFYTFVLSLSASAVGLFAATLTKHRNWQVLISVVYLCALLLVGWIWSEELVWDLLRYESIRFDNPETWVANLAIVSGFGAGILMTIVAAAANITFASDNRATRLRIVMLLHQGLYVGWMIYWYVKEQHGEWLLVMSCFGAAYWTLTGALMTGETAELSPRVKRSLPQSLLARMLFTWFNPGAGTGYVFAVINLGVLLAVGVIAGTVGKTLGRSMGYFADHYAWFSLFLWMYIAAYLGVGRIIIAALRRFLHFGLLLPVLIHIMLIVLGVAIPMIIHGWYYGFEFYERDYSLLHAMNWAFSLGIIMDEGVEIYPFTFGVIAIGSVLIFVVNYFLAIRDVEQVRLATPQRVQEDDREIHPERFLEPRKPKSPWDEDD